MNRNQFEVRGPLPSIAAYQTQQPLFADAQVTVTIRYNGGHVSHHVMEAMTRYNEKLGKLPTRLMLSQDDYSDLMGELFYNGGGPALHNTYRGMTIIIAEVEKPMVAGDAIQDFLDGEF